jgi:hypothetical protein
MAATVMSGGTNARIVTRVEKTSEKIPAFS